MNTSMPYHSKCTCKKDCGCKNVNVLDPKEKTISKKFWGTQ